MAKLQISFTVASGSGTYTLAMKNPDGAAVVSNVNVPVPTQTFSNRPTQGPVQISFDLPAGVYGLPQFRMFVYNGNSASGSCVDSSITASGLQVNCPASGCSISNVSIGTISC